MKTGYATLPLVCLAHVAAALFQMDTPLDAAALTKPFYIEMQPGQLALSKSQNFFIAEHKIVTNKRHLIGLAPEVPEGVVGHGVKTPQGYNMTDEANALSFTLVNDQLLTKIGDAEVVLNFTLVEGADPASYTSSFEPKEEISTKYTLITNHGFGVAGVDGNFRSCYNVNGGGPYLHFLAKGALYAANCFPTDLFPRFVVPPGDTPAGPALVATE
ncbi:MAG: hypothetical protein M1833_006480 [Piccolia ochrophora]|nr:MAG: hypothetical protein M1833_006480 [Piccolia ochrophora]